MTLDATHPDALELRGNLRYWGWLQGLEPDAERAKALLAEAQKDLESATEINPTQAGPWASLSHLYNHTPSATHLAMAAERALAADAFLDNADVILFRLFISTYELGQFPEAERRCHEIRRRLPDLLNASRS